MDRETAKALLTRKTAADSEPTLSDPDLELLLDTYGGVGATSFDMKAVDRAAGEGWDWKASAAAEGHGRESDIYRHCVERRRHFMGKAAGGGAVVKAADTDAVRSLL